jgi:hypothetical protein
MSNSMLVLLLAYRVDELKQAGQSETNIEQ